MVLQIKIQNISNIFHKIVQIVAQISKFAYKLLKSISFNLMCSMESHNVCEVGKEILH
jgi:hypothetical protein